MCRHSDLTDQLGWSLRLLLLSLYYPFIKHVDMFDKESKNQNTKVEVSV